MESMHRSFAQMDQNSGGGLTPTELLVVSPFVTRAALSS
jgi:hypothetical protein